MRFVIFFRLPQMLPIWDIPVERVVYYLSSVHWCNYILYYVPRLKPRPNGIR
jgi:hypothetical protein